MKLKDYGIVVSGWATPLKDNDPTTFAFTSNLLPNLVNYKFSYKRPSSIIIWKNGYKRLSIRHSQSMIDVSLFAPRPTRSILTYTESFIISRPLPLLIQIIESVSSKLPTRKRNVEAIEESLSITQFVVNRIRCDTL